MKTSLTFKPQILFTDKPVKYEDIQLEIKFSNLRDVLHIEYTKNSKQPKSPPLEFLTDKGLLPGRYQFMLITKVGDLIEQIHFSDVLIDRFSVVGDEGIYKYSYSAGGYRWIKY